MSLAATARTRLAARQFPVGLLLVAAPVLLVVILIVYPALAAIVSTLRIEVGGRSVLSLDNYVSFFADEQSRRNLGFTIWTTIVTTFLLILVCLPLALYLRVARGRLPAFVQAVAIFPLFVPGIIIAYALIRFMGPNGTLQMLLSHIGVTHYSTPYLTPWGTVIGLVWEGIPLTLLVLISGLAQIPLAAIESARDVGAGPYRIFIGIILPLIRNSLIVAFSLNFLGAFGSFTLPYVLGPASPEMMGVYMQRTFSDVRDPVQASTQAVITFLACALVGILYVRAIVKSRQGRTT